MKRLGLLVLILLGLLLACGLPSALQTVEVPTAAGLAASRAPGPGSEAASLATAAPTSQPAGTVTAEAAATGDGALDAVDAPLPTLEPADELKQLLLELINHDRAAAGLDPVELDETAGRAAQWHAEEMAGAGYMSHWNLAGQGPPYRYSQAGGLDAVAENVYMYWQRYDDGSPAPIDDWPQVIRDAHTSLMDSPGHRDNILAPEHTGVGLGLAYNPGTGDVRLDELFVDHYLSLEPLPLQAAVGQTIPVRGRLLPGASAPLLNLAYEPFPAPLSVQELNQTGIYSSTAEIYDAATLLPDGQGVFEKQVTLDHDGLAGLYYVRLWVQTEQGDVLAGEVVIEVR